MRSFTAWVTARPYRLILLAIVCVHLLIPASGALLVLDALKRGPQAVLISTLAVILGVIAIASAFGADIGESLGLTAPVLLGSAGSGILLAWSRSLSLAFQGTVVGAIVVCFLVLGLIPAAAQMGVVLQDQVMALLESGGASDAQLARFAAVSANEFLRVLLISLLACLLSALMLGYWWYSLAVEGARFGEDFRALSLGRTAGISLMLLIIVGQLVAWPMLQNLAPMAVIAFLFQGLAVLHARTYVEKWPRFIPAIAYVLLVSPWTYIAIMVLSAVGLIDNFFDLRARLKSPD